MTNIAPIDANPPTQSLTSSNSIISRDSLAEDLDTFLTLLTTQLQNQDPLQPMDTNQFVDQLTQFSELEQGVEQSGLLQEISAGVNADNRQTDLGYLGRVVEAQTEDIGLGPQGASFDYEITSPTDRAEMRIFDAGDNLVARFAVNGQVGRYEAGWDGTTEFGTVAAPGVYRAQVVAVSDEETERLAGRIFSSGTVEEVRFEGGQTTLILDQGMTITADDVRRVGVVPQS